MEFYEQLIERFANLPECLKAGNIVLPAQLKVQLVNNVESFYAEMLCFGLVV